jgi:integrase
MAWLEQRSGLYRVAFRHGGRKLHYSVGSDNHKEAKACMARLEENLRLVERGRLDVPQGADLAVFLVTDGKLNAKPVIDQALTLAEVFEQYETKLPEGAKEANTRYTERIHLEHLKRLMGARILFKGLTTDALQRYVDERSKEPGQKGKPVSHITIQKEIGTLASLWNKWALPQRLVAGPAPTRGLIYSKAKGKPPFATWKQITRQINRGGLTEDQEAELWDCLFLTLPETEQLLAYVRDTCRHRFVSAMFAFAAHTGARRSELLRSQVDDFDFAGDMVTIREKKKDRSKDLTFRSVPMSPFLRDVMHDWLKRHPGGQLTICSRPNVPLTAQLAAHHFRWTVDSSKWAVLKGWHVLRHSFASNAAAKCVDQRLIDEWMGHQTEEMRRRYRHLIPNQQQAAIRVVFG